MRRTLLMALLCSALVCTTAFAGSIAGKAVYDDRVPPAGKGPFRPIDMNADPACAEKHSGPVAPDVLVLGDGTPPALANVFIQVKNPPAGSHAAPSEPVIIDQNGCRYEPHVAGVIAGQTVKFKNSDGILHNVHGLPKVNREFNIGMPPALKEKDQVLSKPEAVFPVKCDVHPWMKSYVAVMSHPFFAVSGADGTFSIDGLADGTYEVDAWHEKLGNQSGSVTVEGGGGSVDFTFKIPAKK